MRNFFVGLLLAIGTMPAVAQDTVKSVVIPEQVAYANKDTVDSAILAECALPKRVAELVSQALAQSGVEVKSVAEASPKSGEHVLLLEIAQANRAGNAMTGRYTSVTVTGKLYAKGKPTATFVATRNSSGGAFGGFKGTCAVLGRCAQAIGQDVARWLKSPVDGAKLGDAR